MYFNLCPVYWYWCLKDQNFFKDETLIYTNYIFVTGQMNINIFVSNINKLVLKGEPSPEGFLTGPSLLGSTLKPL